MMGGNDKLNLPRGLRKTILVSIRKEERKRARIYLLVSTMVVLSSAVGIWFAVSYMAQEFYQSSFYNYFSLLFSDTDIILAYWQQFVLSLAESVPLIGVTVSLAVIAIFLISIRFFMGNVRGSFTPLFNNS